MFCTQCGVELEEKDRYCYMCGNRTGVALTYTPLRRLTRDMEHKKIAGVCAGFAHYFDVDVTLVRIIWLVLIFVPPSIGVISYLLAWIVMPKGDSEVTAVQHAPTAP